ncbi:unnamed protein product, partial [Adineta ricciae]
LARVTILEDLFNEILYEIFFSIQILQFISKSKVKYFIYVDTYYSASTDGISQMKSNSTNFITINRTNLCQQCFDIFVTEKNTLYCSYSDRHQVLAKSLINDWNPLMIVAGTGSQGSTSTTLRYPRGISTTTNVVEVSSGFE